MIGSPAARSAVNGVVPGSVEVTIAADSVIAAEVPSVCMYVYGRDDEVE